MIRQQASLLEQNTAVFAFPGFAAVRSLVSFPLFIVKEDLIAEIARVTVLGLLGLSRGAYARRQSR